MATRKILIINNLWSSINSFNPWPIYFEHKDINFMRIKGSGSAWVASGDTRQGSLPWAVSPLPTCIWTL